MKIWRKPLQADPIPAVDHRVVIIDDRCKGCRFCIEFCPTQALRLSEEFNVKGYHPACADEERQCAGCGLCALICPGFAISVVAVPPSEDALVSA